MSQGEKGKRIKNAGSGNFRRRHFCVKGYCSACTAITCAAGDKNPAARFRNEHVTLAELQEANSGR